MFAICNSKDIANGRDRNVLSDYKDAVASMCESFLYMHPTLYNDINTSICQYHSKPVIDILFLTFVNATFNAHFRHNNMKLMPVHNILYNLIIL